MKNQEIRMAAAHSGVKLWQVAEKLGITDSTFSRKLRKEFAPETKERVLSIIQGLAATMKEREA